MAFLHNGQELKFNPNGNYRVNNSEAILEALIAGIGICQMPDFIVAPYIKQGQLVPVLGQYSLPTHGIYALVAQRKYQPAKVSAFLDFLKQTISIQATHWQY